MMIGKQLSLNSAPKPTARASKRGARINNGDDRILINCSLALLIIASSFVSETKQQLASHSADDNSADLNLSLGLGGGGRSRVDALSSQYMSMDCSGEFKITLSSVEFVGKLLDEFAAGQKLTRAANQDKQLISAWLLALAQGKQENLLPFKGSQLEKLAGEFDQLFDNFLSQFVALINKIVFANQSNELLAKMNNNLAFRCDSLTDELKLLKQLSQQSSIYSYLFDIFSNELYAHCLKRKLAMIQLNSIKPNGITRQFVDLYLNVPLKYSQATITQQADFEEIARQLVSGLALSFNLKESIEKFGPLTRNSNLILDLDSSQLWSLSTNDNNHIIEKFKSNCLSYAEKLGRIWGPFDEFSSFLSSSTNDLGFFNGKIKLVLPELVYATICTQLMATL